ncbi:protein transport protein HofC [Candidatus Symbiopectobacterium sp. NZEC135]|uniref:protein transport protein HofC n=1 Tax=Candidatus Symbiopectobacterium sp. NZEC135 TaxID=2820471 RepID=UPI002227A373|nr:protein transport protein HofC [Candidatus Symbiopectobacterium sp. NZEC135]MCW2477795.1 protein transport protein HofC [Candidatus Symbiopectobacterium sp. NZEC135]
MPQKLYSWLALTPHGELQRGESIGNESQHVYLRLAKRGYQPLRLRYRQTLTQRYWKATARIALFKQIAALLQAGLPLLNALRLLAEQHELPGWRCLINALADDIAEGESFSDALRHHPRVFPALYPTLVAVGEMTGKLDVCCQQLATQQEQQLQLQKKVKQALRYPGFVLGVSITVSIIMLIGVLPEFASLYESFEAPLPPLTQHVLALADVVAHHALLLLTLPVSIVLGYPVCRARSMALRRQEERFLMKIPLLGALMRGEALSYLFTLLDVTQRAGLTLPAGLTAAATLPYFAYQEALIPILRNIEQGDSLQQAITPYNRLFPPPCAQLIRVGEETGALDNMFNQLAQWHQQQTTQRAQTLTHTLEPLLIVLVGGIIGTLVIAMYLPIFQFGDLMTNA